MRFVAKDIMFQGVGVYAKDKGSELVKKLVINTITELGIRSNPDFRKRAAE